MNSYVVLLRGVNVGGHNKLQMSLLREVLTQAGLCNVKTYIQSGNIVCHSADKASLIQQTVQTAIKKQWQYDIPTEVRNAAAWQKIVSQPFPPEIDPQFIHIVLLSQPASAANVQEIAQCVITGDERVLAQGSTLYFYYPYGCARSKLNGNVFEKQLGCTATARNWRTALKIQQMLHD